MKLLKLFLFACTLLIVSGLEAKPIKRTNNFFSYKDPLNEFGYGTSVVYMENVNRLAPQLNIYYSRYFTNYFSVGASYGGLYSKNYSSALSLKISFKVFNNLILSLKPGVYIRNKFDHNELLYFFGFESAYHFKLSDTIVLGPMVDVDIIQDDLYFIAGFQMGFYF